MRDDRPQKCQENREHQRLTASGKHYPPVEHLRYGIMHVVLCWTIKEGLLTRSESKELWQQRHQQLHGNLHLAWAKSTCDGGDTDTKSSYDSHLSCARTNPSRYRTLCSGAPLGMEWTDLVGFSHNGQGFCLAICCTWLHRVSPVLIADLTTGQCVEDFLSSLGLSVTWHSQPEELWFRTASTSGLIQSGWGNVKLWNFTMRWSFFHDYWFT